ncbi:MAG: hypothetical protein ABF479_18270 [Gluconacetobacter sp.]|uniref:Uncharacterized protein n=1 Tax=Gluconacetobacter dulcium TaxID=2729096 RepID=A0A7W4K3Q8_9PROT|nr:hypothetical protein [Gluconacetobacter dulcium]MBB2199622.1 hypothetical protein [Gluconacetobacter dulcium]
MKRKIDLIYPTDAEDAAINRGIALDADNPELTDQDFTHLRDAPMGKGCHQDDDGLSARSGV